MGEEDDGSRFGFGGTSRILILVPQILRSKWDRDQDLGPREECYQEMLSLAGQGQGMTGQQGARGSLSSPFRLGCPSSAGPALPATVADAAVLDGPRAVPGWWWWCTVVEVLVVVVVLVLEDAKRWREACGGPVGPPNGRESLLEDPMQSLH
jgi:hypothetical protein